MISRRDFLIGACVAGGAALGYGLYSRRSRPRPMPTGPNVLMISVDDLNGWIGPMGHAHAKTPNLDRLAARGTTFTHAYCAAPVCGPSRTAVLLGQPPTETGCYLNADIWRRICPDRLSLPRYLREAGYHTASYGKVFHSEPHDDPEGWDDVAYRGESPKPAVVPANGLKDHWDKVGKFDWGAVDASVEEMDDHRQVDRSIAAMQNADRPFFVACGIYRPHLPWYAPQRFFDLYPLESIELPTVLDGDLDDIPAGGKKFARTNDHDAILKAGQWKHAVQAYLASISYADFEIGRLLDGLEASGKADNTAIVLWSDHGWHLGPKNHWRKFALWEEATRSVLLCTAPGAPAGQSVDYPVSLLDVFPTTVDLCGLEAAPGLPGRSLAPLLRSAGASWQDKPVVSTFVYGNHSVRNRDYRYTRYSDGGEELYDHRVDPNEWNNLAGKPESQAVMAELKQHIPEKQAPEGKKWKRVAWLESESRRWLDPRADGVEIHG